MALFQTLCSILIQKDLYFQSKRPNFIPIATEQSEIFKLVRGFLNIPLGWPCQWQWPIQIIYIIIEIIIISSPSSSSSIESGRIISARISASLVHETDVTTSLSNPTNDSLLIRCLEQHFRLIYVNFRALLLNVSTDHQHWSEQATCSHG